MTKSTKQGTFSFPNGHGGRRAGAGRKPKGARAGVPHRTRAALKERHPVHVTLRLRDGLPNLRKVRELRVLHGCFASASTDAFRVCQFSVQSNHLHLIVEAQGTSALSTGVQGLAVRIAKRLNRLWHRRGSAFSDRYHARVLATPREVRNALVYVLQNAKHHGVHAGHVDPCSSGPWFTGWLDQRPLEEPGPFARARTWLLRVGWHRTWGGLSILCAPA